MLTGPRYVLTAWPLRSLVANVLAGVPAVFLLVSLAPLLLAGTSRRLRSSLWRPLLEVEVGRLSLIDPAVAEHVRNDIDAAAGVEKLPALRHVGYVVLVGCVIGPLTVCATALMLLIDAVLLAAPWLVSNGPITVLWWQIESPTQAWAASVIGVVCTAGTAYLLGVLAAMNSAIARLMLAENLTLRREVTRLTDSRAALLGAVEHERQRIEAELHDRVQHRLVALAVTLGIAEATHGENDTGRLAAHAHGQLDTILAELRAVILGIQPRALTEHGLAAAITDLVGNYPLPIRVDLSNTEKPDRLPPALEQTGYLVITELLTNIAKHSQATAATIAATRTEQSWRLTITDNGQGNARPVPDHGLDSLVNRVGAIDGTITIISPAGGPTEITMQCPLPTN